jgi:phosphatidylserine/phosphatidylglycerophosphate/cardiolipin synthase-like enzyme
VPTILVILAAALLLAPTSARAEQLCDPAFQDCRAKLLAYINNEKIRIDFAANLFEDKVLADALVARHRAGLRIRGIIETRRTTTNPLHKAVLDQFKAAGIPLRGKSSGAVFHWKMFMFAGQQVVEFAATNFSAEYLVPVTPYVNYTVDPLYFSTDLALVHSFQRKFDDLWMDTAAFVNLSNAATPARAYALWTVDPTLSFVPNENFLTRSKPYYDAETTGIDTVMYKITEPGHADGLIRAAKRGVPVRLIVEGGEYRDKANLWQAYNVDRLYAAGVKVKVRASAGFLHQKTTLLYGQAVTIFGSSNWTTQANRDAYEHNYFTKKSWFFTWMKEIFERKWFNRTGNIETKNFVPLPPDPPVNVGPVNASSGQPLTIVLSWKPGLWAHRADVYFGTTDPPPLFRAGVTVSPGLTAVKKYSISGLTAGRTYYWRVVSKTMAGKSASGPRWSFGT